MGKKNLAVLVLVLFIACLSAFLAFFRSGILSNQKNIAPTDVATSQEKEKVPVEMGDYLDSLTKDPTKFNPKDIAGYPIKNIDDLAGPLDNLRKNHPDIAEQFLIQDTFAVYADPKTSLEGYIQDQFKKNEPFDSVKLASLPIKTDSDFQVILREIYMKDPKKFSEFSATLSKRYQETSSRRFTIIYKMLNYVNKTVDPADLYWPLSNQKDFFYKWSGWERDLTQDEKVLLYEGKRFLDRFGGFKKQGDIVDIDKEISTFEEFLGRYNKSGLQTYYVGTINLYLARGYLYAIRGDLDKAISIFHETVDATHGFVLRKETSYVSLYPGLLPVEAAEGRMYWIRGLGKEKNGDIKGALEDYKKAEELIHHNLLANPFGLLDTFAFWRDLKDTIKKMES